jgi:hypothetical protein
LELSPAAIVTAEAAVVVARRLEGAHARDAPALARQLVDLTEALRGSDKPDRLDEFLRRSEARQLTARAGAG